MFLVSHYEANSVREDSESSHLVPGDGSLGCQAERTW